MWPEYDILSSETLKIVFDDKSHLFPSRTSDLHTHYRLAVKGVFIKPFGNDQRGFMFHLELNELLRVRRPAKSKTVKEDLK